MLLFSVVAHKKLKKNTLKSCSEKLESTFFSLLPELLRQPKQKDLCSKMWLIDQLYLELGSALVPNFFSVLPTGPKPAEVTFSVP